MKKIIYLAMVMFLGLQVLSGCKAQEHFQQTRSIYERPPFEVQVPPLETVSEEAVPADIRIVAGAIVQRMRKDQQGIPGVSFDPAGIHYTPDATFNYEGFAVTDLTVLDFQENQIGQNHYRNTVLGVMMFADSLGRRTMVEYDAQYELTRNSIVITQSVVRPVPPVFPNTQAFIIEAGELKRIVDQRPDFEKFYSHVVSASHSMTPTAEERRMHEEMKQMTFFQRLRSAPARQRQDNFMVIFVMDRITPDSDLEVIVTETLHGSQSVARPVYKDFSGWRVAIFGGNFAIDRDVFYAKTYYRPARGVLPDGHERVLVGLFTSEKNYETGSVHQEARTVREAAQTTVQEGPLAQGRVFLDTSSRSDATVIQTRLAELGFYNMAIDGLWGPGSRGALQNFQGSNGLSADGQWTMQTQMRLFTGTGK